MISNETYLYIDHNSTSLIRLHLKRKAAFCMGDNLTRRSGLCFCFDNVF